jgi:nucleotidyltransferase AbiEii toxin of type IV toxin-antitoxin system
MDGFLKMSSQERRLACLQVEEQMRLQAASVEKDFWVCWTLRELFALPEIGPHLTFKGGTSLSKAWKLIERFSEDIDLIVDKQTLGFAGDASPDKAPSKKQRNPDGDWTVRHQMTMNGKHDGFTLADFRACAKSALMKRGRAEAIVEEVRAIVAKWPAYAEQAEVMKDWRKQIQSSLRLNLPGINGA